jgi:hypothetical protein
MMHGQQNVKFCFNTLKCDLICFPFVFSHLSKAVMNSIVCRCVVMCDSTESGTNRTALSRDLTLYDFPVRNLMTSNFFTRSPGTWSTREPSLRRNLTSFIPYLNVVGGVSNKMVDILSKCCNTYYTEQSPSWKANRLSVNREIPRI